MIMSSVQGQFTRNDVLLLILAVIGCTLFFVLLPGQHPDSTASYELGTEGAVKTAKAFLADNGYLVGGTRSDVQFRRDPDLLVALQQDLGRSGTVDSLRGWTEKILPAYFWQVSWSSRLQMEGEENEPLVQISLTQDGKVWSFTQRFDEAPVLNRAALASVAQPLDFISETLESTWAGYTDSALVSMLDFNPADSLWGEVDGRRPGNYEGSPGTGEAVSPDTRLGVREAIQMARYHLSQSALAPFQLRVDSTYLERAGRQSPVARIRFASVEEESGQVIRAEVELAPAGALRSLDVIFNPGKESRGLEGTAGGLTISASEAGEIVMFIAYVILVFLFIFLFFRRLISRSIDAASGLRDATIGGFFLGATIVLSSIPRVLESSALEWTDILMVGVGALVVGASGAILVFLLSSVADSITRESWPEKLETATFLRFGTILNRPVGVSLLRGMALSGILLGLVTLVLLVLPGAAFDFESGGQFLHERTLSPVAYLVGHNIWYGVVVLNIVLMGVGGLLYRWKKSPWLVITGLALTFTLVQLGTFDLTPVGYDWLLALAAGLLLAVFYWKYDALTCFTGYVLMQILIGTAPGWLVTGSPERLDAVIVVILFVFLAIVGLVGVSGARNQSVPSSYVPAYVKELAREERLKRELELAQQVQSALLPRKMPQVEGIDVAAMCLAAQEVGGDYYDFVQLEPGRLAIVVGDVSGKGIQAAFYMTLAKGFLQTLSRTVASPAEVLRQLNALFYENAPRGMFISMIYGVIDIEQQTFTFARAGHNPVILKRSPSQDAEFVLPSGMAIGLSSGSLFENSIEETSIRLRPGDVLVFYTDGFSEATNTAKEQYGENRLANKVSTFGRYSAAEIMRAVSEDVHHFVEASGRMDDMTLVVVKFTSSVSRPGYSREDTVLAENAGSIGR